MSLGQAKKPPLMASDAFTALFAQMSKAALIDTLWCACQLGTNEESAEISTQAARNAVIALEARHDRVPTNIKAQAALSIDSDGVD